MISLFQEELDHTSLKSAVLNLWSMAHLAVSYKISYVSDIYITIHKGSKITVIKEQENNIYVGGDHSMKNCP